MPRSTPYGAFNFSVNLNSPGIDPDSELGGFSDVSGLVTETVVAEYRNGNFKENHVLLRPGAKVTQFYTDGVGLEPLIDEPGSVAFSSVTMSDQTWYRIVVGSSKSSRTKAASR